MIRTLLIATALLAFPAFATGERITVTGAASPLEQTLCLQMNCVEAQGSRDFTVSGRTIGSSIEIQVTSASGQHRLTERVPVNDIGAIGSTDLVRLTSLVFKAIEEGPTSAPAKSAVPGKHASARKVLKKAIAHR